ncbi:hypothetical protein Btru_054654 [Bulinus truncatus]|nr:hypothetical protein Btru_054654 [Bulinus truncatus]
MTYVINVTNISVKTSSADILQGFEARTVMIIVWVATSIGIPGNLLAFITICKMKTSSSASFLVAYLAICDMLALITKCATYETSIEAGEVYCRLVMVPMSLSTAVTNWTIVIICVERYIAVHYPLQKRHLVTKTRIRTTVVTLDIVLCAVSCVLNVTLRDYDYDSKSCVVLMAITYHLLSDGVDIFLPFVIITPLTIAVIRKIYSEKAQRNLTLQETKGTEESGNPLVRSGNCNHHAQHNVEKTLSVLMIIAVALYFILNAPLSVYVFLVSPFVEQVHLQVSLVLYVLKDFSHALNIFLYFFLCRGFRKQFIILCKQCKT